MRAQGEEELVKQVRKGLEGLCIVRQWGDAGIVSEKREVTYESLL